MNVRNNYAIYAPVAGALWRQWKKLRERPIAIGPKEHSATWHTAYNKVYHHCVYSLITGEARVYGGSLVRSMVGPWFIS